MSLEGITPFFVVANVAKTLEFYRDKLGFEITFRGPEPDDEFFGIVTRDKASIMFKALDEAVPTPNYGRKPAFSWDAYVDVDDPDALATEFASRGVPFASPIGEGDGLRGFVIRDIDGYGLYFGRHQPDEA